MDKSKLKKTSYAALIWVMIALVVLTGTTFAWFSFTTSTNVTPMQGTVGNDGANLLISNSKDGPFDTKCDLKLTSDCEVMSPVSTYNLKDFYTASSQNADGIIEAYKQVEDADKCILKGSVYLKSEDGGCDIYFDIDKLGFGDDIQALASMRLGIETVTMSGNDVYLFKLDDMDDLSSAQKQTTTAQKNCIYNGSKLIEDIAVNLLSYAARKDSPVSGSKPLAKVNADEIITINYYLYLEGCDENCINDVQSRDVSLSLGFFGVEN